MGRFTGAKAGQKVSYAATTQGQRLKNRKKKKKYPYKRKEGAKPIPVYTSGFCRRIWERVMIDGETRKAVGKSIGYTDWVVRKAIKKWEEKKGKLEEKERKALAEAKEDSEFSIAQSDLRKSAYIGLKSGIDHPEDPYRRGELSLKTLKEMGEFGQEAAIQVNINQVIGGMLPDVERILNGETIQDIEGEEVPDADLV